MITADILRQNGVSDEIIEAFERKWPNGMSTSVEIDVFAQNLLESQAMAKYSCAIDSAWEEYRRVEEPAWEEYKRAKARAALLLLLEQEKAK